MGRKPGRIARAAIMTTAICGALSALTVGLPVLAADDIAAAQALVKASALRAEVRGPRAVWVTMPTADRSLDPADYRLTLADGTLVPVAAVLPNTATEALLVPARDLDVKRVHFLEMPKLKRSTRVRFDGWFRTLYSDKPMGAEVAPDGKRTTFRIFSPRAEQVRLFLYATADAAPAQATSVLNMIRDADGVWEATVEGDLHGTWYDFTVHGPADPGTFFHGTHPVHISDPYARVVNEAQGKGRVWRATKPATPLKGGRPRMEDVVAYEVHVQDFTDRLPVADDLKGTLPAFTMPGLRNKRGEPIGFDHLVDLGVNVVHLLPMQEFLHYPDAEWQATFADDPYAKAQGIDRGSYEWGYRTTHFFAIENRYRRKGTEPGLEREQFRDLVQAFHDKGIAVIVDIVPNHTGENMDGRNMLFNFNVLDRDYWYRTDDRGEHIGPFGNEVKTEDRPMVQRWIIDQCKALIREFGIDGFRIDLAGQLDEQTLIRLRKELGPDVIIYGEPWIDVTDPVVRANPDWDWYKEDAPITFFQDDTRNALQGSPFKLDNKATDRGYAGGNAAQREAAMKALANDWPEERADANRGINYIDIHDNWTLADRFAKTDWDGRKGIEHGPYKLAVGMLLTSAGPIVLHGGSEMIRSKGLAPLDKFVRTTATGPIHFKGRDDTYNVRTPNHFVWDDLGGTPADGPNDYKGMVAYWRGLIALRMSDHGKVFRIGGPVPKDHYRWILPEDRRLLGYVVGGRVLALVNTGPADGRFDGVALPPGRWRKVADGDRVDHVKGVGGPDASLAGGRSHSMTVPATSMAIWVRE